MKKHLSVLSLTLLVGIISFAQHGRSRDRYYEYARYDRYPHARYASYPRVSIMASLPFGAIMVSMGGVHYHYYNGYYYRPHTNGYILVEPPIGLVVPILPPGSVNVIIGRRPYYMYEGIYYMPVISGYQVIERPAEVIVETAPVATTKTPDVTTEPAPTVKTGEYEKITIEGKIYYKKDNSYYKARVDDKGEVVYEKVGELGK